MVLVVNDSLKMSKGKIAAQAGHATLACAMMLKDINPKVRSAKEMPAGTPSARGTDMQLFNRWRMHGCARSRLEGIMRR
jgi:peptidyl-tRNA hydrolase